ncbi:hypothetical protein DL95DRAFT_385258 [Leptodontidium sp. 2 PMI_412]|nr:hypothetical protein DL95DRAFT_385258 [Leptodontidium sp. 2 PMI_412]
MPPAGAHVMDYYEEVWNTFDFRHRLLWIDALCINQNDLEEKSLHVLMMTDTYRDASLVLMYLGQEGEYTQLAVEFIHDYWLQ